jgi:hypothetical protein
MSGHTNTTAQVRELNNFKKQTIKKRKATLPILQELKLPFE